MQAGLLIAIWGRAGIKLGPTPACAELQPLTLKTGPDWPKYARFAFPEGLGIFLGETIFSLFQAQNWRFWGHAH